jgi:hypothetical protein
VNEPTVLRHLTDDDVARLPLATGRRDLLEEVLLAEPAGSSVRRAAAVPRRVVAALAVAAAVAAVGAIALAPPWLHSAPEASVATAPQPVERLLLDAPGWRLESLGAGGATYRGDGPTVEINAYPAAQWASRTADLSDLGTPAATTVVGRDTAVFAYGASDHVAVRAPEGSTFVTVRAQGLDAAGFDALLTRLVPAPDALPTPTGMGPADRDALLARWQDGLSLPSGVDYLDPHLPGVTPEQSTAVTVLRGVGCGWVRDWAGAVRTDDDQARDDAVAAVAQLSTSPAAAAAAGTPAPAEVAELLAAMRSGAAPAALVSRCRDLQDGQA